MKFLITMLADIETAVRCDTATEPHLTSGLNGLKNVLMDDPSYLKLDRSTLASKKSQTARRSFAANSYRTWNATGCSPPRP